MVPPSPTAQPRPASTKATPSRRDVVPELWADHVAPPSTVARITPPTPTAQPWLVSTNATLRRSVVVFEAWELHAPVALALPTSPAAASTAAMRTTMTVVRLLKAVIGVPF